MLKKNEFRLLTVIAAATLLVALTNMFLFSQNRERQQEVSARGQFIQQSVQLEGLYREIVKALADLAVRNNDQPIRDMLATQGISVAANPLPSAAAAAAPAAVPALTPPATDVKKGGK